MPANQTVLLSFRGDARRTIAGKLCDLVAKHADTIRIFPANCIRTSRLCAVSRAIRLLADCRAKIAAAVAEEVPFKLSIVEPKVRWCAPARWI